MSLMWDLKMVPDAKSCIACLDLWTLSWFLSGHLTVLSQLLNVS